MDHGLTPAVHAPQEFLQAILEDEEDAIVLFDSAGQIREWSPAAARIWGYERAEVLGWDGSIIGLGPEHDPEAPAEPRRLTIQRRSGDSVAVLARTRVVRDQGGQVVGSVALVRESSAAEPREAAAENRERALADSLRALRKSHEQLKSTQLHLIQAAKMESIGRLAAGVAHEVKNPLAVMLTGVQLLQGRVAKEDASTAELLEDLESAVKRANRVIIGLLDFARSTELQTEVVDLGDVISEAIGLVRHDLDKRRIRVEREKAAQVPPLELDRMKIEQVLINFMINAMDAMPDGGTLTVRKSMRQLTHVGHGVGFRKSDVLRVGQTVAMIEIEDTGTGIPPDKLDRAFDPFFTTKPAGKGTGLGLAVCRMIAGLHRGAVWLENRPGGGARATLCLPAGESRREWPRDDSQDPARGR